MVSFTLCDSQKKNLRAKPLFFKSPAPRKSKMKVSPFFGGPAQRKSRRAVLGGSNLAKIGDKTFVLYSITNGVLHTYFNS